MRVLSIDIETYSSTDIGKSGLYKYAQAPDFSVLLFAYAYDNEDVRVIDLAQGESIPDYVVRDLWNPDVEKHAYNAAFEIYCLSRHFGRSLNINEWKCTMVHGLYLGYPAGLAAIGAAMGLPQDKRKLASGKALIRKFCCPCKPTKTNGNRTRNLPKHEPEQWALFKQYCAQDVVTEREIATRLAAYPMPQQEWDLWRLDQVINLRGVGIDRKLVDGALSVGAHMTAELETEAKEVTGLENPNSVAQLKRWLLDMGVDADSLNKEAVAEMVAQTDDPQVKQMLSIRQEMAKSSTKKYNAMAAAMCEDERVRGLLQFYGANRTGRWAGRLVQVQNLPRNYIDTLDIARKYTADQNENALRALYGNVPDTLSQLIRTAFIPRNGHKFVVADFSAIEARVIAWLAGENWRLEIFKNGGDIYCASASQMFKVPVEKHGINGHLRQKGKIAELALGYQGSTGALKAMGALKMGIPEEELPGIVKSWRAANKRIVEYWYLLDNTAQECVSSGRGSILPKGMQMWRDSKYLIIKLPSGRCLFYNDPKIIPGDMGRNQISYMGIDQNTKKWARILTYGGKLVENIVQAVARDCLAYAMQNLESEGYDIVMHIHDEAVMEVKKDDPARGLAQAIEIMRRPAPWAAGLPLNADGFEATYYKKD